MTFLSTKTTRISFILSVLLVLSACTTIRYDGVGIDKGGNTLVSAIVTEDVQKIELCAKRL